MAWVRIINYGKLWIQYPPAMYTYCTPPSPSALEGAWRVEGGAAVDRESCALIAQSDLPPHPAGYGNMTAFDNPGL